MGQWQWQWQGAVGSEPQRNVCVCGGDGAGLTSDSSTPKPMMAVCVVGPLGGLGLGKGGSEVVRALGAASTQVTPTIARQPHENVLRARTPFLTHTHKWNTIMGECPLADLFKICASWERTSVWGLTWQGQPHPIARGKPVWTGWCHRKHRFKRFWRASRPAVFQFTNDEMQAVCNMCFCCRHSVDK